MTRRSAICLLDKPRAANRRHFDFSGVRPAAIRAAAEPDAPRLEYCLDALRVLARGTQLVT